MREAASFSIYLPPGPPSRPSSSIEYDRAQPIYDKATLNDNLSILNQMNLILNSLSQFKSWSPTQVDNSSDGLKLNELTSFLSAMALSYVEGKIDPNKNIPWK